MKVKLEYLDGNYTLKKDITTIGRSRENDIYFRGNSCFNSISNRHCEVYQGTYSPKIRDLSRNGTYLNGERIKDSDLKDGDKIGIGHIVDGNGPIVEINVHIKEDMGIKDFLKGLFRRSA
jgi:pSer/pThr/pTyr-binding forkhead associated (FHA) protein